MPAAAGTAPCEGVDHADQQGGHQGAADRADAADTTTTKQMITPGPMPVERTDRRGDHAGPGRRWPRRRRHDRYSSRREPIGAPSRGCWRRPHAHAQRVRVMTNHMAIARRMHPRDEQAIDRVAHHLRQRDAAGEEPARRRTPCTSSPTSMLRQFSKTGSGRRSSAPAAGAPARTGS